MLCSDLGNTGRASASDIDTVRQCLEAMRHPLDGTPVVTAVNHRDALYQGPWVHEAPTLVFKPANERRPPLGDRRWADHVRRSSQSGWHRDQGFVLLDAPGPAWRTGTPVQLQQIAPTIAAMVGRDAPATCEQEPLFLPHAVRTSVPTHALERNLP
jgi:hypothetical protein